MSMITRTRTSVRFQHTIRGKRYSKSIKIAGLTKAEINKLHADWIVECDNAQIIKAHYTVEEYSQKWLKNYVEPTCRPKVIKCYKSQLEHHILPKFGAMYLTEITPILINEFVLELKSAKKIQDSSKFLSAGTIKKICAVFKNMLQTAYTNDLIKVNPFSKVRLSFSDMEKEEKINVWEQEEYKRALGLLEQEENDNKYVIEFALKTGLRLSEIFGLDWQDVNFQEMYININKSRQIVDGAMTLLPTKTNSSKRKIAIPNSIVQLLKEYKEKHPNNEYVFANLNPDSTTRWFRKFEKRNNLTKIRFHDLRHTHASLLLYQGVDIKTISERLGHSSIGITMNVYTHVLEKLDRSAAEAIDAI